MALAADMALESLRAAMMAAPLFWMVYEGEGGMIVLNTARPKQSCNITITANWVRSEAYKLIIIIYGLLVYLRLYMYMSTSPFHIRRMCSDSQ